MANEFKQIPPDLYKSVEPEAGTVYPALTGRFRRYRSTEQFDPNWEYLLTGHASKAAVVACLSNSWVDVPERIWPKLMQLYCPKAWALLADAHIPFQTWRIGECPGDLGSRVSATANVELDGYEVFIVMDYAAMHDYLIEAFGQLPSFE